MSTDQDLNLRKIKAKVQGRKPLPVDVKNRFSVMIPLIKRDGDIHLLFEKRAFTLRNQPGEISFPGGRIEKGESPREAAVRETAEELLISEREIEIYSEGDFVVNPYAAIIYTFVGEIKKDFDKISPSEDEVEKVFTVPLSYFLKTKPKSYKINLRVERNKEFPYHLIPNGVNYKFKRGREEVLFYEYEDEIIWGFTAKMARRFVENLMS
ncbi:MULTISPECIES: NUDIX hydrolase [Peptoniphilus]|uniref:CoA pyrophosphatase n=1 Tax=Peptoniphilus harei TaxID=54005 RepID=A0A943SP04_9FIRM|nr:MULTISPECIES: CoA pyrophosphatase [Peptoniphilus]MBS6534864.1 CoA pyrophosphatase [Peptoniphilus harei]OFO61118.1 coenzyme A pyrophosphatase [Peptoniphilus sp. HMSC075B08]